MEIKGISQTPVSISSQEKQEKEKEIRFEQILQQKIADDKKLKEACQMLESFFIKEILKTSQNSSFLKEDGFMAPGNEEKTFKDMLNDEYAQMMSRNKGIGIGEMLYRQLKKE